MRFKSWPYDNDWGEIFGKDRATGMQAEDFVDAVNHVLNMPDENVPNDNAEIFEHLDGLFDGLDDETETISVCQPGSSSISRKKNTGKKRKSSDNLDPIYELIGNFCRNTDKRLGDIAKRIGYEYDISNARKEVLSVVENIMGLTLLEASSFQTSC